MIGVPVSPVSEGVVALAVVVGGRFHFSLTKLLSHCIALSSSTPPLLRAVYINIATAALSGFQFPFFHSEF